MRISAKAQCAGGDHGLEDGHPHSGRADGGPGDAPYRTWPAALLECVNVTSTEPKGG